MPDDDFSNQLAYIVASVNRQLEEELYERLRPTGIPIEQLRVMEALSRSVSLAMGDLATRALVDPPSLTKIIDRMASESLVIRAPDPKDRRKVLVLLAPAGKALFKRLRKVSRDLEQQLSAHLSRTKADALRSLLRDLVDGRAGA